MGLSKDLNISLNWKCRSTETWSPYQPMAAQRRKQGALWSEWPETGGVTTHYLSSRPSFTHRRSPCSAWVVVKPSICPFFHSLAHQLTHLLFSIYWAFCLRSKDEYPLDPTSRNSKAPHGIKRSNLYNAKGAWEVHQFAKAAVTKYHKLDGLNNGVIFSHGLWPRCQQGWFLFRAVRENLSPDPLLASGGFLEIFGVPWFVEASLQSLPSSSQGIRSTLLQYDLILSNYIFNDLISK